MSKIKVNIVTGSNSRNAGGLFNSVRNLSLNLNFSDELNLKVISFSDEFSEHDLKSWGKLKMLKYDIIGPKKLGFNFTLTDCLNENPCQIVHQQGIWSYNSKLILDYKNKNKIRTIITPRGMLDTWALKNSRWKKKIIGCFYENNNLKSADCIHALCESEYLSIRRFGLKNPVAIIPNGINVKKKLGKISNRKIKSKLLFLGRIHPKKGLVSLIKSISIINQKDPKVLKNWEFIIAGWSELNHQNELEELCNTLGISKLVNFNGPAFEIDKQNLLNDVDAFILPSYSEGLPMSILEAWSYKLPVLMTKECNIPEGFESNSAIKIHNEPIRLAHDICKFISLNKSIRDKIGINGYNLVKNKFVWKKISDDTILLYKWLLNKSEIPEFVKID